MTDQSTRDRIPPPVGTEERETAVKEPPERNQNKIRVEAHRIGVEAVAKALDQAA
jgi:hypothetical protein